MVDEDIIAQANNGPFFVPLSTVQQTVYEGNNPTSWQKLAKKV